MPYIGTPPASELANLDINGQKLIIDADADTSITADTDDQIDIEIAGADDFQFTANTFTIKDGSTVANLVVSGDTAAGDNAAIGYTAAEGLILTGQGSTNDITIKRDDDTAVLEVATGQSNIEVTGGNIFFGTAAKGVYLGVTSATAANLLDDYEEGTYDVTLTNSTSGGYVLASGYDTFSYTKIGRSVTVFGTVNIESESSPDAQLRISLPFTALPVGEYADSGYMNALVFAGNADSDTDANVVGWFAANVAYITVYQCTHGTGNITTFDQTDADTAFSVSIMATYMAA